MSRTQFQVQTPVVDVTRWMNESNGSIFIKYIPNHITKIDLRRIFEFLGIVSRIDIVNIANGGTGRRAFVHFSKWNRTELSFGIRDLISKNYPMHTSYFSIPDNLDFSITLNIRPIPSAELNPQQLSDWSQRLNDELVDFKDSTASQFSEVISENAELRKMVTDMMNANHLMRDEIAMLKKTVTQLSYGMENTFSQLSQSILYFKAENAELHKKLENTNTFKNFSDLYKIAPSEEDYFKMESQIPSEFPGLSEADLNIMEDFEQEIEQDEDRTHGDNQLDENNMDEIDDVLPVSEANDEELDMFDEELMSIKRQRDPLIFEKK
jgi:uncharacterized protein YdiU (UPF0061 family)